MLAVHGRGYCRVDLSDVVVDADDDSLRALTVTRYYRVVYFVNISHVMEIVTFFMLFPPICTAFQCCLCSSQCFDNVVR